MSKAESPELAVLRMQELEALQEHYAEFTDFLYDGVTDLMGFKCTWLQLDIADFMANDPNKYKMVQAQRSQAKTTIASFYAIWKTIHNPTNRTLITSAAGGMASEIAGWIIQIINGWDILECMRPDRAYGDRASTEKFDIHHSLRGPEKSASFQCLGITSSMQGRRADLLIPDDVESAVNSATAIQREKLLGYTRDFQSICQSGEILYLGTPQSIDSIYNTLPGRGFTVRIWPGRFPTEDEVEFYGEHLAPRLSAKLQADSTLGSGGGVFGDRGKPTDPELLPEETLCAKELDQGPAYFQLQHMLCTELSDAARFPLKDINLVFMHLALDSAPMTINWRPTRENKIPHPLKSPLIKSNYYMGVPEGESVPYNHRILYIDPAGGGKNADETGYAVVSWRDGYLFCHKIGGVKGGYDLDTFDKLTKLAEDYDVDCVVIEENYGKGSYRALFQQHAPHLAFDDHMVTGQKEIRIAEAIEPILGRHRLIMDVTCLDDDIAQAAHYPTADQAVYQFLYQFTKLTRDKDCLIHDDRLEALAGACGYYTESMSIDETRTKNNRDKIRYENMMKDPLGNGQLAHMPGFRPMRQTIHKRLNRSRHGANRYTQNYRSPFQR